MIAACRLGPAESTLSRAGLGDTGRTLVSSRTGCETLVVRAMAPELRRLPRQRAEDRMAKNVVICCDGTANEFAKSHTNVLKLFRTLDNQPGRQIAYYHPGLGTMEAAAALTSVARTVTKLLGLAIGYGLERDVRDAYVFLMQHFEPGD